MSAEALAFGARREPALLPSFVLAALVHLFLAAVMFVGVRWSSHHPETVVVELWEAPPPPPPAPVVEAPKPLPKVEPEPPPVQKPEIAIKAPPKRKPEPKPAPRKDDFEKRMREQLAQEQRAIDDQRREAERREAAARQQAVAAAAAAAARDRALAAWTDKIRAKIRGNIRLPENLSGNPEAIFDVAQLPTGGVISIRLRKSSGHKGYDDAVERAILKSSPLPKPDEPNLFERQLELRFRPQDK
ncbi:MAG TPA: energy transducer TonB [Burkholderiales bacterium]|nr:energy transducer TonB [Burkholderiales bacterium]